MYTNNQERKKFIFIDKLLIGEYYSISILSYGCFDQSNHTVTITRKECNGYYASMNKVEKKLSNKDILLIRQFEDTLKNIAIHRSTDRLNYDLNEKQYNIGGEKVLERDLNNFLYAGSTNSEQYTLNYKNRIFTTETTGSMQFGKNLVKELILE